MNQTIIPVWINDQETLWLTQAAIESLNKAGSKQNIIIDNGSTYGAGSLLELGECLRNNTNLGYAKAVNQGLELAGKIVAIANNDIIVSPNCFEIALDILKDKQVGSVHFRMLPYSQDFSYGNETWIEGKERWCTSSFFIVRNVQRYDENFLNSYDDYDFWYRMRHSGLRTAYTNKACYRHLDSHTQKKIPHRSINDNNNREYYKEKYGEYPHEQFARMYPDQVKQEWRPFP